MLSASVDPASGRFTRSDAWRLLAASAVLVLAMSVILGLDILPAQATLVVDKPASTNVVAPRAAEYTSDVLTERQRAAARDLVEPQYDFTIAQGAAIAAQQVRALDRKIAPIEAAFADTVKPEDRATLLAAALPSELREADRATLTGLDAARWLAVRTEAARVLDTLERSELRDTEVPLVADGVESRFAGDLTEPETALGAALIRPLIVDPRLELGLAGQRVRALVLGEEQDLAVVRGVARLVLDVLDLRARRDVEAVADLELANVAAEAVPEHDRADRDHEEAHEEHDAAGAHCDPSLRSVLRGIVPLPPALSAPESQRRRQPRRPRHSRGGRSAR